jgi:hypothetical protein
MTTIVQFIPERLRRLWQRLARKQVTEVKKEIPRDLSTHAGHPREGITREAALAYWVLSRR